MKIFLAGYESMYYRYKLTLPKDCNIFLSYYKKNQTEKALKFLKETGHRGRIIVDSGAHSFFGFAGIAQNQRYIKVGKPLKIDIYKYFDSYIEWVDEWKDFFDYFVELDLQELIGYEEIKKMRKMFKERNLYSKCIPCIHSGDPEHEIEKMLDTAESKYVGIEGTRMGKERIDHLKYIKMSYERGVRIHGFAFTKSYFLHNLPFYSVDSATWALSVLVYARFSFFKNKEGRTAQVAFGRKQSKSCHIKNTPIETLPILKSSDQEKLLASAKEYCKAEKYFSRLWEERGIVWKEEKKG